MTIQLARPNFWFICGSQHLYGPGPLQEVADHAQKIAEALSSSEILPLKTVCKPVVTNSEDIVKICLEANADPNCAGLILWMHTFSPSKMWIRGLNLLKKPFLHLHTQFNVKLPWNSIDMDFMNLNQSAHGDREAGFIHTRMRLGRKVVVGHWSDPEVQERIELWMRAARAWHDWQGARFCRFGDNMRNVAVTEGDKVAAEMRFGFSTNGYGVGDLVAKVDRVKDSDIDERCVQYEELYAVAPELKRGGARHGSLRYAAQQEIGIRSFLEEHGFKGFTTTFEDLHGLRQLPGLAPQCLMADGYGFAGEGDWKTAALVRAMKVMADGLGGGTSFMEDYTYDLTPEHELVLGSHMLEICPTITAKTPSVEIHPLGIGGKEDPVRLVFDAIAGSALNATLVDLGNRFRLLVSEVTAIEPPYLPKLPVARAVWMCAPNLKTACAAWILAGGAHHTAYSNSVSTEMLQDFATIAGIELAVIDRNTKLREFNLELRNNELYYHLAHGILA
jgi:L-arabinose isomerase